MWTWKPYGFCASNDRNGPGDRQPLCTFEGQRLSHLTKKHGRCAPRKKTRSCSTNFSSLEMLKLPIVSISNSIVFFALDKKVIKCTWWSEWKNIQQMKHPSHCVHFCCFQRNLIFTEKNFEMINFRQYYLYLSVRSFTSLSLQHHCVGVVCFPVAAELPQTKKYGVYVWSSSQSCCISFPMKHINLHTPRMDDIWETLKRLLKCKSREDAIKIIKQQYLLSFELCHSPIAMSPWGSARWKFAAESGDSWKHCR